jgi:hypothetical protein
MSKHKATEGLVHVHNVPIFMGEQSVDLGQDHHLLI